MGEYIFRIEGALYNEETGEAVMKPKLVGELIRCKDCKHHDGSRCFRWNSTIITGFDDYCSKAELKGKEE